ncbi:hypothetical protein KR059_012016, partial [Drosophila kikkawai]
MGVTWISYRKKHELDAILLEFGLERAGTVEEQRARLIAFARQPELPDAVQVRLDEMELRYGNSPTGDVKPKSPLPPAPDAFAGTFAPPVQATHHTLAVPRSTSPAPVSRGKSEGSPRGGTSQFDVNPSSMLVDKMTKWGLSFDGTSDPLSFVELIEEGADTYRIDRKYLSNAIVVLLSGRAESWFRTSGLQGGTWAQVRREFLDFFLPPRYYQRLDDEIRAHYQKPNEPFKQYLVDLRLKMRRAGFSPEQELERIYENMLPEYQMFTRRQDFKTLTELTHLVVNFEVARSRGERSTRGYPPNRRDAEGLFSTQAHQTRGNPPDARTTPPMPRPRNASNDAATRTRTGSQGQEGRATGEPIDDHRLLSEPSAGKRARASSIRESLEEPTDLPEPINNAIIQDHSRIRAQVTMEGRPFTATLDTGASHSFISRRLAQELDDGRNHRAVRTQVKLADGTDRELTHALRTTIQLGKTRVRISVLIMADVLDGLLLGMDFLCYSGATLQCGGQTLKLQPPIQPRATETSAADSALSECATTLPRSNNMDTHPADTVARAHAPPSTRPTDAEETAGATARVNPEPQPTSPPELPPDTQQEDLPPEHHAQRHRMAAPTHARPEGTHRHAHADAGTAPSWAGILPLPDASAVRRNPFRQTGKRVRFRTPESSTSESTPSCGMANARCSTEEEQRPSGQDGNYPEPWVEKFLERELARFDTLAGVSHIAEHSIVMRNDRPIKQRYHPRNPAMRAVIDRQIDELLRDGRIEPSRSPHSAPIVIAAKKNGDVRMCVDYRQLNENSIPDAYPLPRIHHILERLRNARYISTLDLKNGYWQIPVAPASRECTAFTVPALDTVIGPDMEPHAFAYLDDIIVIEATLEEHVRNLREVFRRLRAANLRLNRDKCQFFQRSLTYLGHVISEAGIQTDPEKVAAIRELPPPTNLKELRRCLGIASWYRRFVPNFADVVEPMTSLLKKDRKWQWAERQEQAFNELKKLLTEAPILACPDFEAKFVLQTDASEYGIGAVLTQTIDEQERVVAYASRRLNNAERNYSVTEKECLAIVWGIRKMRCYIEGYRFEVLTDHHSLKWLNSIDNPTGRIARWALELQQFQYDISYRRGNQNLVADALSRQPLATVQQAQVQSNECKWIHKLRRRVQQEPAKFPDFREENGQLYRRIGLRPEEEDYTPWKLCVGAPYRRRVLEECHDHPTAGHLGIRKTSTRVAQKYYWPGLFREVAQYVRRCSSCQKFKVSQEKPAGKMFTRQVNEPFHVLCADFVGPLPRSKQGNTVLLVFFDIFSKWVELVPLRRATVPYLERAFRERILSRFGIPRTLVCDNGTQFTSRAFQAFCNSLGMELQHTAPYTPRQNPTERANRTVKTMIAQYLGDSPQSAWDHLLPEISLAINSSVSDTTGFSPAFLVQGREPRLPNTLYDEVTPGRGTAQLSPTERSTQLHSIFQVARENAERATAEQGRHYNLRRREWRPPLGSLVLVRRHVLSNAAEGFAAKLASKYEGPYRVIKFPSPNIARLQIPGSRRRRTACIQNLKPYHQDSDNDDDENGQSNDPAQTDGRTRQDDD